MKLIKNKKNKNRLKKGLIFAGLAGASIALLSQPALAAKGGKQYHEDEWKKTKTYGNTVIAEDSASDWGPWQQFIQPAAGPIAIAPMPGMRTDGSNYYRPESVEEYSPKYTLDEKKPVVDDPCQGGDWCGYMAYRSTNVIPPNGDLKPETTYERGGPVPTRLTMGFTMPDGAEGDGTVTYALTRLTDGDLNDIAGEYYNSGDIPVTFYGSRAHFHGTDDPEFYANNYSSNDQYTYGPSEYQWYGNDDARWGTSTDPDWTGGPFVAGNTTPLADMATRGEMAGTINFNGMAAGGADVTMNVDFAGATWDGSWNNGADSGTIAQHTDSSTGIDYITGRVGFNAAGSITGADFRGAATGASDGDVTGTVVGNFFGADAETLGGITDITKTVTGKYDDARNVDVFVACEGGCRETR
ncbi:hypothetical protein MNBD_DELTA01-220 [hydrothermal vent metagenome]|uniref:Transferrin-binding protein B C-lobe/N-lobe beta-barrel domain-containing protein n=1 Tax=hydrothermal vent metagenome TaxID=652676 RepID=A0A3B0QUQ0_9ZZZZ